MYNIRQHIPSTPPRLSPLAPRLTSVPVPLAPVAAARDVNAPLQRRLNQRKPCIPHKAGMSLMSPAPRFATYTAPVPKARASNTGRIAEYKELSQCGDGEFWQVSANAEKIVRLAHCLGSWSKAQTKCSSSTCLQFPAAAKPRICVLFPPCVPKKQILVPSAGPAAATRSTSLLMSAPKPKA